MISANTIDATDLPGSRRLGPVPSADGLSLTARFSVTSLACIVLVSSVSAVLLSRFLVEQLLHRDAEVSLQFVQTLTAVPQAAAFFGTREPSGAAEMNALFERLRGMPDVLRANVYRADRSIIWSSNPAVVGSRFEMNPELDTALAGQLAVEADILEHRDYVKPEHVFGGSLDGQFVENYIPVWNAAHEEVIGVVELYKEPKALFAAIQRGLRLIWLCAIGSGLALFAALLWIVRRGDAVIRDQHARLVTSATASAVGELAAAIAHSIRNPLAAIRSSAELLDDPRKGPPPEEAADIMAEVDRIEGSIRALLTYTQADHRRIEAVNLNDVARVELAELRRDLNRRHVTLDLELVPDLPAVTTDPAMLAQIVRTLLANAIDAIDAVTTTSGRLIVRSRTVPRLALVELAIIDDGCGMTAAEIERAFRPFHTTKKNGLGVGLPLVRRTLERLGGRLEVASAPGEGTAVSVQLPIGRA